MNFSPILLNSLWAALFATGLGTLLTAPLRYLVPTFMCGFAGRFVRDVLMGWGINQNWSTVIACTALVLVAATVTNHHRVSAVVLICSVLPLGATVATFHTISNLVKVSTLTGDDLNAASVSLVANAGKAFAGTLSIALGLGAGIALVRFLRLDKADGV